MPFRFIGASYPGLCLKVVGTSDDAEQLQLANPDLDLWTDADIPIYLVEENNRLRVMIDVGENDKSSDLRAAIPLALKWRDRLVEWQGTTRTGSSYFLEELCDLHKKKISYQEIANHVTGLIREDVRKCSAYITEYDPSLCAEDLMFLNWPIDIKGAYTRIRYRLSVLNFSDQEIKKYVDGGLKAIEQNTQSFASEPLLDRIRIRDIMKSYQASNSHRLMEKKRREEFDRYWIDLTGEPFEDD